MESNTNTPQKQPGTSWFMAFRSQEARDLIRHRPKAFLLLWTIYERARWHHGYDHHGLEVGQAFLGDHKSSGLTEGEYRSSKKYLEKHGFATFRATRGGTDGGTIATLNDSPLFPRVFSLGQGKRNGWENGRENGWENVSTTDGRRMDDGWTTINIQGKKELQGKKDTSHGDSEALAIYDIYPRKVGKPVALKAIAKAIKAHGFEHVRDRTAKFAELTGEPDRFTPHPSTFFNQERFNDDPETWSRTSGGSTQPTAPTPPTPDDPGLDDDEARRNYMRQQKLGGIDD